MDRGSRIVAETAHGLFEQSFESIDVGFVPTLFATVGGVPVRVTGYGAYVPVPWERFGPFCL